MYNVITVNHLKFNVSHNKHIKYPFDFVICQVMKKLGIDNVKTNFYLFLRVWTIKMTDVKTQYF